jgi:mono/diheme cytochrome c family protein
MACGASWGCLWGCAKESKPAPEVPVEKLRSAAVRARGEQLFRENCVLCHGEHADGKGVRSMGLDRKPANFTDPLWSQPESAARAFQSITRGVPGSPMPSWGTALSAEDRWALVAYITAVSEKTPSVTSTR